jgi:hypothetical protein
VSVRARVGLLIAVVAACKAGDKQPVPPPSPARSAPVIVADAHLAERPSLPTPATEPPPSDGAPLSLEDAAKAVPPLTGKSILPLRQTSDKRQVHATWCLDGDAADEVAREVGRQMATAGYGSLAIRGNARKAGVQGDRDGFRMSMVVSASSAANCPAPKHYFASATIFRP